MSGYQRHPVNQTAEELRGRIFTCTRCKGVHEIVEVPAPFIDPKLYVCDVCNGGEEQLVFEPLAANGQLRRDRPQRFVRRHDPAIARIPFGTDSRSDWLAREPDIGED